MFNWLSGRENTLVFSSCQFLWCNNSQDGLFLVISVISLNLELNKDSEDHFLWPENYSTILGKSRWSAISIQSLFLANSNLSVLTHWPWQVTWHLWTFVSYSGKDSMKDSCNLQHFKVLEDFLWHPNAFKRLPFWKTKLALCCIQKRLQFHLLSIRFGKEWLTPFASWNV